MFNSLPLPSNLNFNSQQQGPSKNLPAKTTSNAQQKEPPNVPGQKPKAPTIRNFGKYPLHWEKDHGKIPESEYTYRFSKRLHARRKGPLAQSLVVIPMENNLHENEYWDLRWYEADQAQKGTPVPAKDSIFISAGNLGHNGNQPAVRDLTKYPTHWEREHGRIPANEYSYRFGMNITERRYRALRGTLVATPVTDSEHELYDIRWYNASKGCETIPTSPDDGNTTGIICNVGSEDLEDVEDGEIPPSEDLAEQRHIFGEAHAAVNALAGILKDLQEKIFAELEQEQALLTERLEKGEKKAKFAEKRVNLKRKYEEEIEKVERQEQAIDNAGQGKAKKREKVEEKWNN